MEEYVKNTRLCSVKDIMTSCPYPSNILAHSMFEVTKQWMGRVNKTKKGDAIHIVDFGFNSATFSYLNSELSDVMWALLDAMPQEYINITVMYYREHLTVTEIAKKLECSQEEVNSKLSMARAHYITPNIRMILFGLVFALSGRVDDDIFHYTGEDIRLPSIVLEVLPQYENTLVADFLSIYNAKGYSEILNQGITYYYILREIEFMAE